MRATRAAAATLLLAACTPPTVLHPSDLGATDADLRWIAITHRSPQTMDAPPAPEPGELVDLTKTPLVAAIAPEDTVDVYGWAKTNPVAALLDAVPAAPRPLRLAERCDYRLPPPDFARTGTGDAFTPLAPAMAPSLTGEWLTATASGAVARCPTLLEQPIRVSVDSSSLERYCSGLLAQRGCALVLEVRDFGCLPQQTPQPPTAPAYTMVDVAGAACATPPSDQCAVLDLQERRFKCPLGRGEPDGNPDNDFTVAPVPTQPPAPAVTVVTATVAIRARILEPDLPEREWNASQAAAGNLADLVVLEDKVVVFEGGCGASFHVLEPMTLRRIGAPRPWGRCNTVAVRAPDGRSIIAVWDHGDGAYEVGRLDAETLELVGPPQPLYRFIDPRAGGPDKMRSIDVLPVGTSTVSIAVVLAGSATAGTKTVPFGYLTLLEPRTLAKRPGFEQEPIRGMYTRNNMEKVVLEFSGAVAIENKLAIMDDTNDKLWLYNVDRPIRAAVDVNPEPKSTVATGSLELGSISLFSTNTLIVASPTGPRRGLFKQFGAGDLAPSAFLYQDFALPTIAATWPASPRLMLVAATAWSPYIADKSARVYFYEPANNRFLEGGVRIGEGIASRMRTHPRPENTSVWVMLPWSGQVARVAPRL